MTSSTDKPPQVILAFVISAYVVLLWTIVAYCFGLLPPTLLRPMDRLCLFANSRRVDSEWSTTLQKGTLVFSDQQIIMGISILIAGYASLNSDLSAYHWQIITYLAWMSSNVHLTTLTLLRDLLYENPVLLRWRIIGMSVLLLLLIVSLVPTSTTNWIWMMLNTPPGQPESPGSSRTDGFGIPAACFWGRTQAPANIDAIFSFTILIFSSFWKMAQLCGCCRLWLKKMGSMYT